MKSVFITDTHLGARNSSKVFRELFRSYYKEVFFPYIKANKITHIFHGGDFFDNRNSVTLNDIDFVINEFLPLLKDSDATMYVLSGNHDVAYKNTNRINSLALLKSSNVAIVDSDLEIVDLGNKKLVMCPWINNENEEHLVTSLNKYANDDHILLGHLEVVGAKMYKNSKLSEHGFKPSDLKGFHQVLSGHFHHRSTIGNITYLGALFHYNWQDYGDWRGFSVYDSESDSWELIENEYCLFTQFDFHEDKLLNMSKKELKDYTDGQIVRIIINEEYNRVDLKEVVHKIEAFNPISIDVVDNTIIDHTEQVNEDIDISEVKTLDNYFAEYVNHDSELIELFNEIKEEAQQRIVEFE